MPSNGLTCIELADDDPTIAHVKRCLNSTLLGVVTDYDLFLGEQLLEDSASLADFNLTESCDYVTLRQRGSVCTLLDVSRQHASQSEPCEQANLRTLQRFVNTSMDLRHSEPAVDAIEPSSPSMSQVDPIESTPREPGTGRPRKFFASRHSAKRQKMERRAEDHKERFGFPTWRR